MRTENGLHEVLFTVAKLEDFVPVDHPLRASDWWSMKR